MTEQVNPPWLNKSPSNVEKSEIPIKTDESISKEAVVSSPFKKIIPILVIFLVIGFLLFLIIKVILPKLGIGFQLFSGKKQKAVTLTYWGLWEPAEVMAPLIDEYQKNHPHITIKYQMESIKDYRERLQSALTAGKGPDIFRIHSTWLPMFINQNQLASVPDNLVNWDDYYPVVRNLNFKGKYYAVPLEYEGLALFYNLDLFQKANLNPPQTWEEVLNAVQRLVVKDSMGRIQTAGIALGTTTNVDHWSDILALMMLQNGANLNNPTDTYAQEALKFYSLFYRVYHVWDETLPASTYAFSQGKVAMILAPSWRVFEIKELNPNLNFGTLPVPQLTPDESLRLTWANFWVEAVSEKASDKEEAWKFLQYLASAESLKKLYHQQSQIRLFGEPYPLKSLAKELENQPLVGAFISQAPYAKTWYLCSRTFDNGINDRMIKYFEDAVNGLNAGNSAQAVLQKTSQGVNQLLGQYGLLSP